MEQNIINKKGGGVVMEITINGWVTPDRLSGEASAIRRNANGDIIERSTRKFVLLDKEVKPWIPEIPTSETVRGMLAIFPDTSEERGSVRFSHLLWQLIIQDLIWFDVKE